MDWLRFPLARNSSLANVSLALFFALLVVLSGAMTGCKKRESARLAPSEIHAITRELAGAARSAAPTGTEIRTGLQSGDQPLSDYLSVTLFSEGPDYSALPDTTRIERSLGAVATRHGLTKKLLPCPEGLCFQYVKSGVQTHTIHFQVRPKVPQITENHARPSSPKLAIILDDLGSDRAAAEAIFALGYPLTISVLPNHEHSAEIAEEAHRRGFQVMLHLPMQSVANQTPEAQELRLGMPATEVAALVDQLLKNVPDAAGVNNHQGSQATADPALMDELMPVLRAHHVFYVDSRTTAATVAYETAQDFGVRSAFRNVPFLDDVVEVPAIRNQLRLALRGAREKGEAIAIGHPHPATLQALREMLPQAEGQGVRLVPASELVH